jgi:signal transduction histidine kinase
MRNIQSKIKITVLPVMGEPICPRVITDKLWLQENLLCLLSNAVKYSTDGENMRLRDADDLEDDIDEEDEDLFGG